ncbi:MAG: ATP-binding protein, partial [Actinomycetota bacterium]
SPVPVTVEATAIGRFPQEIEAAVYFSVLEALQNTAKYAHASHVSVALERRGSTLAFMVTDDGDGFDPTATGHGSGLQGITDRLGALDGRLAVRSASGSGTSVSGHLPFAADIEPEVDRGQDASRVPI